MVGFAEALVVRGQAKQAGLHVDRPAGWRAAAIGCDVLTG